MGQLNLEQEFKSSRVRWRKKKILCGETVKDERLTLIKNKEWLRTLFKTGLR